MKDEILFGAAYYLEYMPQDCDSSTGNPIPHNMETDLRLMKKAGMNVIRIGESTWSTWEPSEGVFHFSLLNRMLELAEKYELQVIVGTPTYAIPDWLVRKYPDILALTHGGPSLYGHRQNMDITHPGYRRHCEIIIRHFMEQVQNHSCVIGVQLDNETKAYDTCGPAVQASFAQYLQEKFSSLDALNEEFGLAYWSNRISDWNRLPDVRGTINGSLNAEFKAFQRQLVTEFLTWQSKIVREYLTDDQFITQNFDYGWHTSSYGMQPEVDQYEAAKCLDIAGCDIYHPSQLHLTGAEIAMGGALARSLKRASYLLLETQAQGNITWLPYEGQLRLQAYSHLLNGSLSVMYWNWHSIHNAIESYWKGVLSHDLTENATYLEAVTIGKELQSIGSHLLGLKKQNRIAILLDNRSLSGIQEFSLETGTPNPNGFDYNDIFRMVYDAFYRMNLECDILQMGDVIEHPALFSEYEMIVTPALYSCCEEVLRSLDHYVQEGGHLLSTFKTGFSNEHLKIYHDMQPHILTDCFGMHYQQFTVPEQVNVEGYGSAQHFCELLIPDTAEVWAHYDNRHYNKYAAITCNTYGKGSSCYIGTCLEPDAMEQVISRFCKKSNIPVPELHFPLIRKTGMNRSGHTITCYLNYSDDPVALPDSVTREGTVLLGRLPDPSARPERLDGWDLLILEG